MALITLAGKPRSSGQATGTEIRQIPADRPAAPFEQPYAWTVGGMYGLLTRRHMHEYGTTMAQLAWVKVAASHHAQHNPHALLRKVFTVDDVLASPLVADPLRRGDCCVITDGGGALVLVRPEIARTLQRPMVGRARLRRDHPHQRGRPARPAADGRGGHRAAGLRAGGCRTFRHQVRVGLRQLHDHGGAASSRTWGLRQGRRRPLRGRRHLISGSGRLPWNTDGGGMCSNHPQNRGGITKVIEAVRQLRGEAHPAVQVPGCDLALATGPGW